MSKLKSLFIFLLIIPALNAFEEQESSLRYLKMGAVHPPAQSGEGVVPTFGLGMRCQRDHYGYDLSLNLGTLIFTNEVSVKGMFLYYPYPEQKNQLYLGMGPGVGYHVDVIPMGAPYGGTSHEYGYLTAEGVAGYEWRPARPIKPFVELGISQPVAHFRGRASHKPGSGLSFGFGF
jgi:hypothetical protein